MERPESVDDAVKLIDDNTYVGHYGPYLLRSAYQPLFSLDKKEMEICGVEGLVRPKLDDTPLSPFDFFSRVDEEDQFFIEWMCRALQFLNFTSLNKPNIDLYINLDPKLYTDLEKSLDQFDIMVEKMTEIGFKTEYLVCEIIETQSSSKEFLRKIIEKLRSLNIRLAVDDFGADFSNFQRVVDVQPDCIKLDRVWSKTMMISHSTTKILEKIIQTFRDNGITVILEGIETEEQLRFARNSGCNIAQGFYLAKPEIPPCNFEHIPLKLAS